MNVSLVMYRTLPSFLWWVCFCSAALVGEGCEVSGVLMKECSNSWCADHLCRSSFNKHLGGKKHHKLLPTGCRCAHPGTHRHKTTFLSLVYVMMTKSNRSLLASNDCGIQTAKFPQIFRFVRCTLDYNWQFVDWVLGSTYFVRKSCSCDGRWVGTSGKMSRMTWPWTNDSINKPYNMNPQGNSKQTHIIHTFTVNMVWHSEVTLGTIVYMRK